MKCPVKANPQTREQINAYWGWGEREGPVTVKDYEMSFGSDKNVLALKSGERCTLL